MAKVLDQKEVTLDNLVSHLSECGLSPVSLDHQQIRLRTDSGIGFRVTILEDKPFVHFGTYLPIATVKTEEERLAFVHLLNTEIFLPVFGLDSDRDLTVSYVMPYQYGLIADQFTAVVHRFASLLQYVVGTFDTSAMIDFCNASADSESQNQCQSPLQSDAPLVH